MSYVKEYRSYIYPEKKKKTSNQKNVNFFQNSLRDIQLPYYCELVESLLIRFWWHHISFYVLHVLWDELFRKKESVTLKSVCVYGACAIQFFAKDC